MQIRAQFAKTGRVWRFVRLSTGRKSDLDHACGELTFSTNLKYGAPGSLEKRSH